MGPNGTQSRCVKSLRDGRWNFTVLAFFRSKAFYASRLSPKNVSGKRKNISVFTFLRRVRRWASKSGPFFTLCVQNESYTRFQSKKRSVSCNFRAKVKMTRFDSFWVAKKPSRWNLFLLVSAPKPCANQCFLIHFAHGRYFDSKENSTFPDLVKILMLF